MIKFVNHSTLGRGDHILVKKLVRIRPGHSKYKVGGKNQHLITKGRIEKSPLGYYQYFEPATNELNPSLTDHDLDKLKEKVERHLQQ